MPDILAVRKGLATDQFPDVSFLETLKYKGQEIALHFHLRESWERGYRLDVIAALQNGFWRKSRVDLACTWNTQEERWGYAASIWVVDSPLEEERDLGSSQICPTLESAWLDAVLDAYAKEPP